MAENNKSTALGCFGGILGVTGGIMCYAGNQINSDYKKQFDTIWNTGKRDVTGDALLYCGIGLIIIGLIMIVINIVRYYQASPAENGDNVSAEEVKVEQDSEYWLCPYCGTTNSQKKTVCLCGKPKPKNSADNEEKKARSVETAKPMFCPNCSKPIKYGMFSCPNCDQRIDWSKIQNDKPEQEEVITTQHNGIAEKNRFCIYCGEKLDSNAAFCGACGKKI